jgi:hypothetical protein
VQRHEGTSGAHHPEPGLGNNQGWQARQRQARLNDAGAPILLKNSKNERLQKQPFCTP